MAYDQGRLCEARGHLEKAITLLEEHSPGSWELDLTTLYLQWTTTVLGDYALLARATPGWIERAFERDHVWAGVLLSSMHGIYGRLAHDEREACREQLARAERRWQPMAQPLWPDAGLLIGEVARLIYGDRAGAALALLDERRPAFARGGLSNRAKLSPALAVFGGGCAAAVLRSEQSRTRRA